MYEQSLSFKRLVLLLLVTIIIFLSISVDLSSFVENKEIPSYWYDFTKSFSLLLGDSNTFNSILLFFLLLVSSRFIIIPIKNKKLIVFSTLFVGIYLVCDNFGLYQKIHSEIVLWIVNGILLFKLCFLSYFLCTLIYAAYNFVDNIKIESYKINVKDSKYFFVCFFVVFIFWLPYFISYLPGSAVYDALWQIAMGLGLMPPTDHHPWPSTWLFAQLVSFFNFKDSIYFLIPVTCFIFSLLIFLVSLICLFWKKLFNIYFNDNLFIWFPLIIFAVVPIYPNYGQTIIKDGVYSVSLCLFYTIFSFLVLSKENYKKNKLSYFVLIFSAILSLCFRHNGAYIIIPTIFLAIIFYFYKKQKIKHWVSLLLFLLVFQVCYKYLILEEFNIQRANSVETVSLPSQALANIIKETPRLSSEEKADALKYFTSLDNVKNNYNSEIFDNIKPYVRLPLSSDHVKVFLSLCKNHSTACLRGVIGQIYLYFYPSRLSTIMPVVFNYNNSFEAVSQNNNGFKVPAPVGYAFPDKFRSIFVYWTEFWTYTFPFSLFMLPAYSTWLILALLFALCFQKNKPIWLLISVLPTLVLILNLLSPVNGDTRYSFPCISFEPTLILLIFILIKKRGFEPRVIPNYMRNKGNNFVGMVKY